MTVKELMNFLAIMPNDAKIKIKATSQKPNLLGLVDWKDKTVYIIFPDEDVSIVFNGKQVNTDGLQEFDK